MTHSFPTRRSSGLGPGRAQRDMLLQTLVGAWPPDLDVGDEAGVGGYLQRVEKWQIKAMREAKLDSNWVQPNLVHEKAATAFLDSLLPGAARHALLCNIAAFAGRLAPAAAVNSLSPMRSEERRVGKECDSTCRSR